MISEKGKLKKAFIEATILQGDPRSYNEIQADLELDLWSKRFDSIHEIVGANTPETIIEEAAPMGMGGFVVEEPNQEPENE